MWRVTGREGYRVGSYQVSINGYGGLRGVLRGGLWGWIMFGIGRWVQGVTRLRLGLVPDDE